MFVEQVNRKLLWRRHVTLVSGVAFTNIVVSVLASTLDVDAHPRGKRKGYRRLEERMIASFR